MRAIAFDRETMLDLTVNVVPLGILLVFVVAFAVVAPWGVDPLVSGLQFTIVGGTAAMLVVLTYVAGKAVSTAEEEMEESARTPSIYPVQGSAREDGHRK